MNNEEMAKILVDAIYKIELEACSNNLLLDAKAKSNIVNSIIDEAKKVTNDED